MCQNAMSSEAGAGAGIGSGKKMLGAASKQAGSETLPRQGGYRTLIKIGQLLNKIKFV